MLEPFCRPELIAPRIAAVLMPPSADMSSSFGSEPCISRRTSWRKDITSSVYTFTKCRRRPSKIRPPPKQKITSANSGEAIRRDVIGRSEAGQATLQMEW